MIKPTAKRVMPRVSREFVDKIESSDDGSVKVYSQYIIIIVSCTIII